MSTFDYDPDEIQRCSHCKKLESQHVWTCDGCQGALRVGPDSQPLLHRCLPNGATLRCPAERVPAEFALRGGRVRHR
jgi:hypothetical protein